MNFLSVMIANDPGFFFRQIHLLAWVFYSAGQIAIFNPLNNFDASLST